MKKLQGQVGQLPAGVPATRAVTELANGQLKAVGGGGSGYAGGGSSYKR
jgi:hypothetical protein